LRASGALKGTRKAWFDGGYQDAQVYDRYALAQGDKVAGPAIIEETESTTIVPPGCSLSVDDQLCLRIEVAVNTSKDLGLPANATEAEVMERLDSDPVTLEIMWSRLVSVTSTAIPWCIRRARCRSST
jgi:5-oxoprolinase (ATP-hydrolysing)/N-methylhydantoinase A